ncbi:MAG: ATP-binding cassette domain-containing protein [Deltaproteobacteria bacterium]|nr:ATP-binding cassette domain-containing protein [Deltaproteobacteria bacterium]
MSALVSIRDLRVHFPVKGGRVRAVDGVSLDIAPGETVGLVGESGCGKSTTGRALLQLYTPKIAEITGEIRYQGNDLVALGKARGATVKLRPFRKDLQIIFQDPYASLDPRMTIGAQIAEPLRYHALVPKKDMAAKVAELLETVGLSPAMAARYPHEFSGGQRQRVGIARALAVSPRFIVCDEPISALDVSIQAQVMNLMVELQDKFHLTYLFIAHDLAAVKHISDRIAVMYLGQIVELAAADAVYDTPLHPYTQALISAVPIPDPSQRTRSRIRLEGEIPSPLNPPSGCRFHPRCTYAETACKTTEPPLTEVSPGRFVACHPVARGVRFPIREAPASTA